MKIRCIEMVMIALVFTLVATNLKANEKPDKMHPGSHHEWHAPKEAEERRNPTAPTSDSIARGKDLFQKNCVLCHGPEGQGDGPAAGLSTKVSNLVEVAAHHSEGNLAWKIETGRAPMPAWRGIRTENQIWDLLNYIRDLGKHPGSE